MENSMSEGIKLFNDEKVRVKWDSEIEEYYFSVIDVIAVLTESKKPRDYWYRLKKRELEHGVAKKKRVGTWC